MTRKPDGSFSRGTVQIIWDRDQGRCAWCGTPVHGARGLNWSAHHRLPRGAGGTSDPTVGRPSNGVLLHGSGADGCHGFLESHREVAEEAGFIIRHGTETPRTVPIRHAVHGVVRLRDDGTFDREEWL